jgi:hypothetical protein
MKYIYAFMQGFFTFYKNLNCICISSYLYKHYNIILEYFYKSFYLEMVL